MFTPLARFLWILWATRCPRAYRVWLVPGWTALASFVTPWLRSSADERKTVAARWLTGGGDSVTPTARWLQYLGSLTLAFLVIESDGGPIDPVTAKLPPPEIQERWRQIQIASIMGFQENKKGVAVPISIDEARPIPGPVPWRTVGASSAAQLSGFRLLPDGVSE